MAKSIIPRHQFILWLAIQQRLADVDRLERWGIQVDKGCVLYSSDIEETMSHLLLACPYSKHLWGFILAWLGKNRRSGFWQDKVQWASNSVNNSRPRASILGFQFCLPHLGREECKKISKAETRELAKDQGNCYTTSYHRPEKL